MPAPTPWQGATAGSYGIARGGMQLRHAAATARETYRMSLDEIDGRPVRTTEAPRFERRGERIPARGTLST